MCIRDRRTGTVVLLVHIDEAVPLAHLAGRGGHQVDAAPGDVPQDVYKRQLGDLLKDQTAIDGVYTVKREKNGKTYIYKITEAKSSDTLTSEQLYDLSLIHILNSSFLPGCAIM